MAINALSVDPAELEKAASSMNDTYNEMTKIIGEMEQLIVSDLRPDWHGDYNHRKFRDGFKRGLASLRANQQAVSDFAAYLERAATLYKQLEGEVDDALSRGSFAGK